MLSDAEQPHGLGVYTQRKVESKTSTSESPTILAKELPSIRKRFLSRKKCFLAIDQDHSCCRGVGHFWGARFCLQGLGVARAKITPSVQFFPLVFSFGGVIPQWNGKRLRCTKTKPLNGLVRGIQSDSCQR